MNKIVRVILITSFFTLFLIAFNSEVKARCTTCGPPSSSCGASSECRATETCDWSSSEQCYVCTPNTSCGAPTPTKPQQIEPTNTPTPRPTTTGIPNTPVPSATDVPVPTNACTIDCNKEVCAEVSGSCTGTNLYSCDIQANTCRNGKCNKCSNPGTACCGYCVPQGWGCSSGTSVGGTANIAGWLLNDGGSPNSESYYGVFLRLEASVAGCSGAYWGDAGGYIYNTATNQQLLGCRDFSFGGGTSQDICFSGSTDGLAAQSLDGSWKFGWGPGGWGSDPNNLKMCVRAHIGKAQCTFGCDSNHPENGCSHKSEGNDIESNELCFERPTPTPTPSPTPSIDPFDNMVGSCNNSSWPAYTRISWEKSLNASFYKIWKKINSGTFNLLGSIPDPNTTTVDDMQITTPNTYGYTVQACRGSITGVNYCRYSDNFVTIPCTPPPTPTPFCGAPNGPAINSPSMGSCVRPSTPFTVRDSPNNTLSMCYPYDAWGRILQTNGTIVATSNWDLNRNIISAHAGTFQDFTFTRWDTAPNLTTGSYIFRSLFANNFEMQSLSPSTQYFNVDVNPPSVPVVNCNVSRDQSGKVTVDIPITSVSDTGCANLNASPYWVQLSKDVNFTSVVPGWFNSWVSSSTVHFETTTTTLKPGDILYYHARSRDALENQSAWSDVLNCRVPSDGPSCSNMSFNPPSPRKTNQNITVSWQNFDDAALSTTNAFVDNTLNIGGCWLLGSGTSPSCSRNWTPTVSKNYTVTATVVDMDNKTGSCTGTFCADSLPPPVPTGGISCSFKETRSNINYYTVQYNWNPVSDQACAGLHTFPYWAQISTTSNYATTINYEIAAGGIRLPDNGWSGDLDTLADVTEGTPIFAHVASRDRADNQSVWSTSISFTPTKTICIGTPPTPSPTPTIPAATATLIPTRTPTPNLLAPIGSCGVYNATRGTIPITFRWSGTTSRQLQVYEKSGSTISFWWYNKAVTTSPITVTWVDNARTPYAFPANRRIYSRFGTSSSSPENSIICTPPVSVTPTPTTIAPTATATPIRTPTPTPFVPPRKAWFQSQGGNIMAFKGNISSQVPAGKSLNTFLPNIASSGTSYFQENFSAGAAAERKVNSSIFPELTSFSDLKKRFTTINAISGDNNLTLADLTKGTGALGTTVVYEISGNSTLAAWNNFSGNAVIFVNGSLTVNGNITVAPGSFLGLVTSGDISVNPSVNSIQGFFFTNGIFQTGTKSPVLDSPLVFSGTFVAGNNFNLQRNLGNTLNTTTAAESFQYRPDFAFSAPLELRRPFRYWQEQAP